MVNEWQPEEYTEEEVLSLDRLKRAVVNRVYKRAEAIAGAGEEYLLDRDKTARIVREEWARAKEAVKTSKAAKENLQRSWEEFVDGEVNGLIGSDKDELSSMGVREKTI